MKSVWIIEQYTAEPYENYEDGVHSVYFTKEAAFSFYEDNEGVVLGEEGHSCGYYLAKPYEMAISDAT